MKLLEQYVPEKTLEEDVFFYGGNMFVCEQWQRCQLRADGIDQDDRVEKQKEHVFVETLNL